MPVRKCNIQHFHTFNRHFLIDKCNIFLFQCHDEYMTAHNQYLFRIKMFALKFYQDVYFLTTSLTSCLQHLECSSSLLSRLAHKVYLGVETRKINFLCGQVLRRAVHIVPNDDLRLQILFFRKDYRLLQLRTY